MMNLAPTIIAATIAALAASMTIAGPASANPYRVAAVRAISGPTPFPHGCPGAVGDSQRINGAEIEPSITVNPSNPRNIVATWQQDLGLAARTDLIGVSRDGGRTWRRRTISALTVCTGGRADAASDPWVSAGPRGAVYFSGAEAFLSSLTAPPPIAFGASHSADGGLSWSTPSLLSGRSPRNDKETIAANPRRAGHAYMVWANRDMPPTAPSTSFLRFSRTQDGGTHWSKPTTINHAPTNAFDQSSQIIVLPHGALLALFSRVTVRADGTFAGSILASRSTNEGRTWQPAVRAQSMPLQPFTDPQSGDPLPNQDDGIFSASVGPGGATYIAWDQNRTPGSGSIRFTKSTNGGRTWSTPRRLPGVHAFAFEPAIAIDAPKSIGITWYDMRHDHPSDNQLTTDVWFAHSNDGGKTWKQSHVAGPFDYRSAPRPGGFPRLGEYQGLAPLHPRGFAAIFTIARPRAQNGPDDIYFARIERTHPVTDS
jgi:hypothetical protein